MDVNRQKILFIAPSMRGGGSERNISLLLKHFPKQQFAMYLALLMKEGPFLSDIPGNIEIFDLKSSKARFAVIRIWRLIKNLKPDIVVSTLGYLNLLIALIKPFCNKRIKFIARESSIVSVNNQYEKYPFLFDWLYKKVFHRFDRIIALSESMKSDLITNFGLPKEKIQVINNPIDELTIRTMVEKKVDKTFKYDKINLVGVGRLHKIKGFDILINAMLNLEDNYYLYIVGEGMEELNLKSQVKSLNLEKRVHFAGFSENPYSYMSQADIFILSSRYEGFPNVAIESLACGTPVVAFDAPGGTSEIVKNEYNGFLIDEMCSVSLAEGIKKVYAMKLDKQKIKKQTEKKYGIKQTMDLYIELFNF